MKDFIFSSVFILICVCVSALRSSAAADVYRLELITSDTTLISDSLSLNPLPLAFRSVEDNLHDANYFVAPSARPYIQGYGLYRNQMLFMNTLGYGFSKNFSATVGFEFSSISRNEKIFFASSKLGAEIAANVHLAGGYILVSSQIERKVSQGFGVLTIGNQEINGSIGMSYGKYFGASDLQLTYNASVYYQFSDMVAIMTENHLIPNSSTGELFYIGFQGVRVVSGDHGYDVGLAYNTLGNLAFDWNVLPFLGYNLLF